MNNDYENLKAFWNNMYKVDYDKINIDFDIDTMSPSPLFNELFKTIHNKKILDYGCGNGWASLMLAGDNNVFAVDVVPNSFKLINFLSSYFNKCINTSLIDDKWINNTLDKFDMIVSINVLDIVPYPMALNIIEGFNRILNKDGIIIVGLNYYINPSDVRNVYTIKGNGIYIDNILRMTSLSDSEWKGVFNKYFDIVDLKHFSWPGEDKELRRLFILKKR